MCRRHATNVLPGGAETHKDGTRVHAAELEDASSLEPFMADIDELLTLSLQPRKDHLGGVDKYLAGKLCQKRPENIKVAMSRLCLGLNHSVQVTSCLVAFLNSSPWVGVASVTPGGPHMVAMVHGRGAYSHACASKHLEIMCVVSWASNGSCMWPASTTHDDTCMA